MKIASVLVPMKADGTFEAELPDGADVLEWENVSHFVRIVYTLHTTVCEEKEPWQQ